MNIKKMMLTGMLGKGARNLNVAGFNRAVGSFIQYGKDVTVNNLPTGSFTAEGYFFKNEFTEEIFSVCLFFGKNYMVDHGWGLKYDSDHIFTVATNFQITDAQKVTNPIDINGAWHHIAYIYDSLTRTNRMYIDGAEPSYNPVGTKTGDGANFDDSSVNGMIGSGLDGTVYNFPGMIGWIRISNIVRYTNSFTPPSLFAPPVSDANTLRLFKNNEGHGTVVGDYSPNGLNGVFTYGDWDEVDLSGAFKRTKTFSLSGNITEGGLPLSGVTLTLGALTVTTDVNGNYSFSGLSLANAGTLIPSKTNYTFTPASIAVPYIMDNLTGKDFTGEFIVTAPAVVFDGTTKIALGSEASLDNVQAGDITVEGWFKSPEATVTRTFVEKGGYGGSGWWIGHDDLTIDAFIACATTYAESKFSKVFSDNAWHHIAFTYSNAGDRKIRFYFDGIEPASYILKVAGIGDISSDAPRNAWIGAAVDGTYAKFIGKVGWVRISNSIRYTGTFTPTSRTHPPANDANTVRLFTMSEGAGTVIGDSSTNAQNGTLSDGSWVSE